MEVQNTDDDAILEETFGLSSNTNCNYRVRVTETAMIFVKNVGDVEKRKMLPFQDVIGCKNLRRRVRSDGTCNCHPADRIPPDCRLGQASADRDLSAYLQIYGYVMKSFKIKTGQRREKFVVTLRFRAGKSYAENAEVARKWRNIVFNFMARNADPKSTLMLHRSDQNKNGGKMLVILNPKSGAGKSREIFQKRVVPVLFEADIDYDLHVTSTQNDARNLMRMSNVLKWKRGVVTIGGDGVLYEVVNGIMERPDWKKILTHVPFGIIPGGSGNGLAKSLSVSTKEPYDSNPVLISTLNIVHGSPTPVDLVRVETKTEVAFSFLSIGWGLIADIDIESERLRIIGSQRFTLYSLTKILGLKTYCGRLSFLRVPEKDINKVVNSENFVEIPMQELIDAYEEELSNKSFDFDSLDNGFNLRGVNRSIIRAESFYSARSNKSTFYSTGRESSFASLPEVGKNGRSSIYGPPSQMPPLNDPVPKYWEVHQGEFVLVHAAYQSHLSGDVFFAPGAKLHDGIIWLMIVKAGVTRSHLVQFLLALSSGNHLKIPNVEMIPVLAFRLEPLCPGSYIVVDGEVVEHGPIQAEIFAGMMSMLNKRPPGRY